MTLARIEERSARLVAPAQRRDAGNRFDREPAPRARTRGPASAIAMAGSMASDRMTGGAPGSLPGAGANAWQAIAALWQPSGWGLAAVATDCVGGLCCSGAPGGIGARSTNHRRDRTAHGCCTRDARHQTATTDPRFRQPAAAAARGSPRPRRSARRRGAPRNWMARNPRSAATSTFGSASSMNTVVEGVRRYRSTRTR